MAWGIRRGESVQNIAGRYARLFGARAIRKMTPIFWGRKMPDSVESEGFDGQALLVNPANGDGTEDCWRLPEAGDTQSRVWGFEQNRDTASPKEYLWSYAGRSPGSGSRNSAPDIRQHPQQRICSCWKWIRSARPAAWLPRRQRLRRAKLCYEPSEPPTRFPEDPKSFHVWPAMLSNLESPPQSKTEQEP